MRILKTLLLAVSLASVGLTSAGATRVQVISNDMGGEIGAYLKRYDAIRRSGKQVIIDGPCVSACTFVTFRVPHDRVCITSRAVLGFHSAWMFDKRHRPVYDRPDTVAMWNKFPPVIQRMINEKGWDGMSEHPNIVPVRYHQLLNLYKDCNLG